MDRELQKDENPSATGAAKRHHKYREELDFEECVAKGKESLYREEIDFEEYVQSVLPDSKPLPHSANTVTPEGTERSQDARQPDPSM